MQTYPTFYPKMNNNCQMPMQNPYMERMAQLQQYQQSLQQPLQPAQMSGTNQMSALGKMVDSIDVVKATACSMRTRTKYRTRVETTPTGGIFKLLGNVCCAPNNNLRSINGTAPVVTTGGGENA